MEGVYANFRGIFREDVGGIWGDLRENGEGPGGKLGGGPGRRYFTPERHYFTLK